MLFTSIKTTAFLISQEQYVLDDVMGYSLWLHGFTFTQRQTHLRAREHEHSTLPHITIARFRNVARGPDSCRFVSFQCYAFPFGSSRIGIHIPLSLPAAATPHVLYVVCHNLSYLENVLRNFAKHEK